MIDCFLLDVACTSLSMSPTGTFLATAHVDDLGVYLWSNCTLYSHVSLRPLQEDFEPSLIEMPSTLQPKPSTLKFFFVVYKKTLHTETAATSHHISRGNALETLSLNYHD